MTTAMMTSEEPQSKEHSLSGWFQRLSECGYAPGDSIELKRQKSLLTVVTLLKSLVCAGWYVPLFLVGAWHAAMAPVVYQILTTGSVLLFAHDKGIASFRVRQLILISLLPAAVHYGLGGFAASGGTLLWSFLAPLLSLLFEGPRKSMRWFLIFLAIVVVAGAVEAFYLLPVFPLPGWMRLMFFVLTFMCVTGITYAGVRYFEHLLEKEKELQVQLNSELQQANEHKSKFLAGMSHELRTPLNAIIGFTRIVKRNAKKALPEKQISNLDKVLVSAEHLLHLINDILDLAKIEAGHVSVENEFVSLQELVQANIVTCETLLRPGVVLRAELQPDLPEIYSDRNKIKQIVLNLISNAAKFTHQGEIVVTAGVYNGGLQLAVRDTGIGISQEALSRIFQEFQQASSGTTREYGGTGLGLSISQRLSQMLGGFLTVESVEGKGSSFVFHLPLSSLKAPQIPKSPVVSASLVPGTEPSQEPSQEPFQELSSSSTKTESQPLPNSEHSSEPFSKKVEPETVGLSEKNSLITRDILAIDDDPDVIYLLQENLQDSRYRVVGARSGEEGLKKARTLQPFAITLDIRMPKKDGWQTLHDLKRDPQTRDIPVIMLSIVDNKQLGYQLGATDFLLKPLNGKDILNALSRLVSRGRSPQDKVKVLAIDDSSELHEKLRVLLQDSPYELQAMELPATAIQALERTSAEVLIVDLVKLPQEGMNLIMQLRKHPDYCNIPILVISTHEWAFEHNETLFQQWIHVLEMNQLERETLLCGLRSVLHRLSA